MDKKLYKKCPRCKEKLMISASKCAYCGFNYAKLVKATNAGAKEQIKSGHRENVIYVNTPPSDLNKKDFLILFWAFGWLGLYNIYIGKYRRGIAHIILAVLGLGTAMINYFINFSSVDFNYYVVTPLLTIYGFFMIGYFIDIFGIIFKRFKYPVSVSIKTTLDSKSKERL